MNEKRDIYLPTGAYADADALAKRDFWDKLGKAEYTVYKWLF
jgi:hypothetical protein